MKRQLETAAPSAQESQRDSDSPYLLTHEAAALLRFSEARLFREWAQRNRVPVLHRGRTLLYDRRVLEAFLQQKSWTHARTVGALRVVEKRKSVPGNGVAR